MISKYWQPIFWLIITSFLFCSWSFYQGWNKNGDLLIYSKQTHDAIWHVALQQALSSSLPPENPVYAGEKLIGYHYLTDLIWVAVNKVSGLSLLVLYLKIAPVVLALGLTTSTLILMLRIFNDKFIAYLASSLAILGSGFAYLVSGHQSVFWLDQPINWLVNQQLALSISLINIVLILYLHNFKKYWWLIGILSGLLVGVKAYAGVIVLPALIIISGIGFFKDRNWRYLASGVLAIFISGLLIKLISSPSSFPFIFEPGWFIKTMYLGDNRLNNPDWALRYQVYLEHNNYPHLIWIWVSGLLVFLLGNFNLKVLGLLFILKLFKSKYRDLALFLSVMMIISLVFPQLFLQKGVVWNSIQFMHYAQIPLTILLVLGLKQLLEKITLQLILIGLILISIPTTIITFSDSLKPSSFDQISNLQIQNIKKVQNLPQSANIFAASDLNQTSIVPAISGRSVYFADPMVNDIILINYALRQKRSQLLESLSENCQVNDYLITQKAIYDCQDSHFVLAN